MTFGTSNENKQTGCTLSAEYLSPRIVLFLIYHAQPASIQSSVKSNVSRDVNRMAMLVIIGLPGCRVRSTPTRIQSV